MPAEPPPAVLRAFGVRDARPLSGGQGTAWIAAGVVLKPDAGSVWNWLAPILHCLSSPEIRVAEPVTTRDGAWSFAGWSATTFLPGRPPGRSRLSAWREIVEAGRAFHRAVGQVARPECLDARTDPWAMADRAAWGEMASRYLPEFGQVARRLVPALSPLGSAQLVHGDLTGNVLVASGRAPAVIDVSPYWRPPEYAEAIVAADALCWHVAPARLLDVLNVSVPAVARALLFRIGATSERVRGGVMGIDIRDEAERYTRATASLGL